MTVLKHRLIPFSASWEEKTGEQYKFFVKRDESDGVEKVIEGKGIVPKNKAVVM